MTISYTKDISDGRGYLILIKLLSRWKGSLYKLVWVDLVGYLFLYYLINFIYRFALSSEHQKTFEEVVKFCDSVKNNTPISFLLGFFVTGVIARWSQMYLYIPRLNKLAFIVEGVVNGNDKENCRKLRQTVMRYLNLSWIMCLMNLSNQIKKRFKKPKKKEYNVRAMFVKFNLDPKIQATYGKIITQAEIQAFEDIEKKYKLKNTKDMKDTTNKTKYNPEFWIPIQWASRLIKNAHFYGCIGEKNIDGLIKDLESLRGEMHTLQIFSGIMIPLVYTQVILIAVYSYFLCQIIASQLINPGSKIKEHEVDLYIPIFSILQFLFLMGWLKVAMCVMNPFGEDDEDFKVTEILDYNLDVTFTSVTVDLYPKHFNSTDMYSDQPSQNKEALTHFMELMNKDFADNVILSLDNVVKTDII